jgi:hypothetical protein
MKAFLDYIDILHPNLKEDTSNLSAILPSIVESGLPSKRIVLETYSSDRLAELSNRPFNELFQFCTGRDSQRTDAAVGFRCDQVWTAEIFESPPHGVEMDGECPSSDIIDCCEYTHPSAPWGESHYPHATGRYSETHVGQLFDQQSVNCTQTAQPEFLNMETLNLQSGYSPVPEQPGLYVPVPEQFDLNEKECLAASTDLRSSNLDQIEAELPSLKKDLQGLSDHLSYNDSLSKDVPLNPNPSRLSSLSEVEEPLTPITELAPIIEAHSCAATLSDNFNKATDPLSHSYSLAEYLSNLGNTYVVSPMVTLPLASLCLT